MPQKPDQPRATDKQSCDSHPLRRWKTPRIEDLPPLTELTLATGDPIDGGGDTGGGGSTVF